MSQWYVGIADTVPVETIGAFMVNPSGMPVTVDSTSLAEVLMTGLPVTIGSLVHSGSAIAVFFGVCSVPRGREVVRLHWLSSPMPIWSER